MTLTEFLAYQGIWVFILAAIALCASVALANNFRGSRKWFWSRFLLVVGIILALGAFALWNSTLWIDFSLSNR